MLLAAVVLAAAVSNQPPVVHLQKVELDLPTPDQAVVILHGGGRERLVLPALKDQRLRIGDLSVQLSSAPDVVVTPAASRVSFTVQLRQLGEGVLDLDSSTSLVRWEGLDASGKTVLVVAGVLDLGDPAQAVFPDGKLYPHYASLADYSLAPDGLQVKIKVLLAIYNPFGFEVVATGMQYRLDVGEETVVDSERGGFRLRPARRNEILIEESVPLFDLAAGMAAFLARQPAVFTGVVGIRTPQGERSVPILLRSTP